MTTLAEFVIIADADNRPPMLEKSMYDSWKSSMELYIENMENGRMILNSVLNGPLVCPTIVEENGTTRTKKYEELSIVEKLQADCDLKATNIFDKFSFVNGETLYQYYWRFAQLINNMNVINMSMRPVQVKTKFLNSLLPEWSKFMTDVKLARDLHTTNFDQLYSYLEQHEAHANEPRLLRERYQDPTLFTRKAGNDILLVQIYVDDIIFASTNPTMCDGFAKIMTSKFKMSMMGQMTFLGLQISQSPK
ncbi:retrovirus-related pol polyprotein from transposon TNT 1-94 [Tanacetum coccineum]